MNDDSGGYLFLNKTMPTIRRIAKNLRFDWGKKKARKVKMKGTLK
jgi:hypothetical protein